MYVHPDGTRLMIDQHGKKMEMHDGEGNAARRWSDDLDEEQERVGELRRAGQRRNGFEERLTAHEMAQGLRTADV